MAPKVPTDYGNAYLHCRTFGHSWHSAYAEPAGAGWVRLVLLCNECKTRRLDTINRRTGSIAHGGRRYEYPPGYQSARGEAVARQVYRVEFIRRIDDG